jgi:pimeloyl-ACP methyl ester carboxylesterase
VLGARIACETARRNPNRVVVLILVDAVTGAAWDRRMRNVRRLPLLFAPLATEFLQDFAGLLARIRETDRSADLIRLGFDTYIGHVQHPMQLRTGHPLAHQGPAQRAAARRDRPGGSADGRDLGRPGPAGLPRLRREHRRDH